MMHNQLFSMLKLKVKSVSLSKSTEANKNTSKNISEDSVIAYLKKHPNFFQKHESLLLNLTIPHPLEGDAISLIERRMQLLQVQHSEFKEGFEDLIFTARENEYFAAKMHHLSLALLESATIIDVIYNTQKALKDHFNVEYVEFRFTYNSALEAILPKILMSPTLFDEFEEFFRLGKPQCGLQLNMKQSLSLFDENAPVIASSALIALRDQNWQGILAIGSKSGTRYTQNQGTHFLNRIGELVLSRLSQ
ncbi:hypothetical protein AwWohl_12530 [Gammaproteobacteria bacterium]|nr:hypothetical protein AwWohl_12530 [Gammaproteobacteria bacterium]